jgi:uncharacterized membrane protein
MIKRFCNFLSKIVTYLSHPAWTGIGAIASIIGLIGLSVLYVGFRGVFNLLIGWFDQSINLSRIVLIIVIIIAIIFIEVIKSIIRKSKSPKNKVSTTKAIPYFSYWDVLWKIDDNATRKLGFTGPYCPEHFLKLEILRGEYSIEFKCQGLAPNESHKIHGPDISQLIIPKGNKEDLNPEMLIRLDIHERIDANQRRNEILRK